MPQKTTPSPSSALTIELTTVGGGGGERPCFPREQDKKHRRMIANSNERRRMQSINAGFQMLKNLIRPQDADKLSKASVLQQAVEHIRRLEMEKTFLLAENKRLEHLVCSHNLVTSSSSYDDGPVSKRRKIDTESSDEGVSMVIDEALAVDELRRQLDELRQRLECERQTRALLEQQQLHLVTENYAKTPTDSFPDIGIRYSVSAPTENVGLRGSLETIIEAIQHLEEAPTMQNSPLCAKSDNFASEDDVDHDDSNSAPHSMMFRSGAAIQLPATELMRVVAAAEALQCFAKRQEVTRRTPQSFPCILQPVRSSVGSKLHHRLTHPQRLFHSP